MSDPLRVVFLGSDPIALPLLDWLAGEGQSLAQVIAVFTQPDRETGRGQKVVPNAIKTWARERGIMVYQPEKLTEEVRVHYAILGADLALVMAYGHILKEAFIETPRLGTFNLHASILPRYRGASPIQSAIANGERETGVAFMRMVRRLDAGPVTDTERVSIEARDTARDVEAKLAAACVPLMKRVLPGVAAGMRVFEPQEETLATYCRKLTKEDGAVDFAASAKEVAARINGLFPWPGCTVEIGGQSVKLGQAEVAGEESHRSGDTTNGVGAVVGGDGSGLLVRTADGVVRILKLQRPGGRMLEAAEFLRGFPVAAGTVLPSRPMPPLVAAQPFK